MKSMKGLCAPVLSGIAAFAVLSTAFADQPGAAIQRNVQVTVINGLDAIKAHNGAAALPLAHKEQMSLTSGRAAPGMHAQDTEDGAPRLPLWIYHVNNAPRDGLNHIGAMVGTNPFSNPRTSRIPTVIVPMIITTHTVATGLDSAGIFSTVSGDVTQNSGAPQSTCLTPPNNVPSTLIYQSPVFQNAPFTFGGTFVGDTQYIDAFQRASFWQLLSRGADRYHVLFDPVRIVNPVTIDVPANEGLAIPSSLFGLCGPVQILDINWFDSYINGTLLPQLAAQGVNAGVIPVFFLYNTDLASPVTDVNTCCVLGYHSFAGEPMPNQTYSVAEVDVSGLFPPSFENSAVLSHELGELVDDPFTDNEVPPWGHTGQVAGCQENLEVGDPLTGTGMPTVTMPNGYTYNLQELAFFSWFMGGKSLGVDGWYSNNGTFTSDAGPLCGS